MAQHNPGDAADHDHNAAPRDEFPEIAASLVNRILASRPRPNPRDSVDLSPGDTPRAPGREDHPEGEAMYE